jgi:hypothetical protein
VEVGQLTKINLGIMGKPQTNWVSDSGRNLKPRGLGSGFNRQQHTQNEAKPHYVNKGMSNHIKQRSPFKWNNGKTYSQITQDIPR